MLRLVLSLILVTLLVLSCEGQNDQHHHNPCPTMRPCICNGKVVTQPPTPSLPDGVSPAGNRVATSSSEESSEEHGTGNHHVHDHGQGQGHGHDHGQGQGHGHDHGQGQGHDHSGHNHTGHNHDHQHRRCPPQPPCVCPEE